MARPAARGADARFDGPAYAQATGHHRAHDDATLEGLALHAGMRLLDLGCGVGDLTADVAGRVDAGGPDGGRVVGVDASRSCLAVASARATKGLSFLVGRAQDVGRILAPESFDAVLSVAVLHWVPETDQVGTLSGVARVLRPGGVLRADLGGEGQIAGVRAALEPLALRAGVPACPWFFPSAERMGTLAVSSGLAVEEVRTVRQRRSVPDVAALDVWLTSQVLPAYLAHVPTGDHAAFTAEALDACRATACRDDGSYDQEYVRIHLSATRPVSGLRERAGGMPGGYAVVADVLASTASLMTGLLPGTDREALLSGRFRRLAAAARRDPGSTLEALAMLRDDLRRPAV